MGELDSSLCQLNWLIAKGGCGPANHNIAPLESSTPVPTISTPSPKYIPRRRWDNNEKPPFSYSQLIRMAIESNPARRCTLSGIYAFIESRFAFYAENRNASWRNSVRHNLSLNKQFRRMEKPNGEKGAYWICVQPPERKPRVISGSPVRINPAIERMFLRGRDTVKPTIAIPQEPVDDVCLIEERELTDDEIRELNLFDSCDLSSSFRDVYNQICENHAVSERNEQIDWLKISVEAAGLDPDSPECAPNSLTANPTEAEEEDDFDWNLLL